MSALPSVTDHLYRQAIIEIQSECRYSIGSMAYELGTDPTTLKRWLAGDVCDFPFQQKQEDRLLAAIPRYLASYTGPVEVSRRKHHEIKAANFHVIRHYDALPSGRRNPLPSTCSWGHSYTPENTGYYPKANRRYCITCKQEGRRV